MKNKYLKRKLASILTLVFTFGTSTTGVLAFYDVKRLQENAHQEINNFRNNYLNKVQAEVNDYQKKLIEKHSNELQRYKDNLLKDAQKDWGDLGKKLNSEKQKIIDNQIKETNQKIMKAQETAQKKIQEEYAKILSELK